jgi:hypothetical protein
MGLIERKTYETYNNCVYEMRRRFSVLECVIEFGIKNGLKISDRLVNKKYDKWYSIYM